jgi:Leucine-rich repeat (LRR) protein
LYEIQGLEILDLSENDIEYISPSINNLHNLTDLNLGNNCIRSIKFNLQNLQFLDLSYNILLNIPQFKRCYNLMYLILNNNYEIYDIPHNITKLKNLQVLDISFSDVDYIPPRICKLKHLQVLNIKHTLVTKIPNSLIAHVLI